MSTKQDIIKYCNKLGIDCIGFTNKEAYKSFEKTDPFTLLPKAETIISIAFPYKYEVNNPSKAFFSRYTLGKDYHRVVSSYLKDICEYIGKIGGSTIYFSDNNILPERHIANVSGVGFIGKNNMLITKKYGSFVFLGEIITDLELEAERKLETLCNECEKCLKACPTAAINKQRCNFNICLSYITQEKQIEDSYLAKFKGRLFGCDSCQEACPYNMQGEYSKIEEFRPLNFMESPDLEELIYLDNNTFKEKYSCTAAAWRGKNILTRNALINYINQNGEENIKLEQIKSPYIKDYYYRLLSLLKL